MRSANGLIFISALRLIASEVDAGGPLIADRDERAPITIRRRRLAVATRSRFPHWENPISGSPWGSDLISKTQPRAAGLSVARYSPSAFTEAIASFSACSGARGSLRATIAAAVANANVPQRQPANPAS